MRSSAHGQNRGRLGQKALEVSGCDMIGPAACGSPFHKQADGEAPEHSKHPDARIALHAAAVVVVGDIQALMEPVFNAPALAVEREPGGWIEPLGRGAGDQRHCFVFSAGGLAQQSRHLGGEGKADVFALGLGGAKSAVFMAAFVLLLRSGFGGATLPEGGNPLGER